MEKDKQDQDMLKLSAVEALHQTMIVLREELEDKNRVIRKLRKKSKNPEQPHSFPMNKGCLVTIEDSVVPDR